MKRIILSCYFSAALFGAGPPINNVVVDDIGKSQVRITFEVGPVASPKTATLGNAFNALGPYGGTITFTGSNSGACAWGTVGWPDHGVVVIGTERMGFYYLGPCSSGGTNVADVATLDGRFLNDRDITPATTAAGVIASVVASSSVCTATYGGSYSHRQKVGFYAKISGGPFPALPGGLTTPLTVVPDSTHYSWACAGVANGTYTSGISIGFAFDAAPYYSQDHTIGDTVTLDSYSYVLCYRPTGGTYDETHRFQQQWQPARPYSRFQIAYLGGLTAVQSYDYKIIGFEDGQEWYAAPGILDYTKVGCTVSLPANATQFNGTFTTAALSSPVATLPQAQTTQTYPTSFGRTTTVNSSDCNDATTGLQKRINDEALISDAQNAAIYIPHTLTCSGSYLIKDRAGTGTLVIRTDTPDALLPDAQTRMTPAYKSLLPRLEVRADNNTGLQNVFHVEANVHDVWLMGLNIGTDPNTDALIQNINTDLVYFTCDSGCVKAAANPTSIRQPDWNPVRFTADRLYLGGQELNTLSLRSCFHGSGSDVQIINNYCHNGNSHKEGGIFMFDDGNGPFRIENNFISGGSDQTFFADTNATGHYPHDVTYRRNYATRPISYFYKDPSFPTQTVLPITAANQGTNTITLTTSQGHDIGISYGSNQTTQYTTISGATGGVSDLNGLIFPTRLSATTFSIPRTPPLVVASGATMQMNSAVYWNATTTVTWSLVSGPGSINGTGLYSPGTVSTTQVAVIRATSTASGTALRDVSVLVKPSTTFFLLPARTVKVFASQTVQLTATIAGSSFVLSPNVGSINSAGLYTAPSSIANDTAVLVTATNGSETAASIIPLGASATGGYFAKHVALFGSMTDDLDNSFVDETGIETNGGSADPVPSISFNGSPHNNIYKNAHLIGLNGSPIYTFTGVPNGTYTVVIDFAEPYAGANAGYRVVDIAINGTTVLSNFDMFVTCGLQISCDQKFSVTSSTGTIAVTFNNHGVNYARVSGVELYPGTLGTLVAANGAVAGGAVDLSGQTIVLSYGREHDEKNLYETKQGYQHLIEGNIFEHNWSMTRISSAQKGYVWVITPRGADAAQVGGWPLNLTDATNISTGDLTSRDITFRSNIVRDSANGMNIGAFDNSGPMKAARRVSIINNLFYNMDGCYWIDITAACQAPAIASIQNGVEDVVITHNTALVGLDLVTGLGSNWQPWNFDTSAHQNNGGIFAQSNILSWGPLGPQGTDPLHSLNTFGVRETCIYPGCDPATTRLTNSFTGGGDAGGNLYLIDHNVFVTGPSDDPYNIDDGFGQCLSKTPPSTCSGGFTSSRPYLKSTWQPDDTLYNAQTWVGHAAGSMGSVGFVNMANKDFRLASGTSLKKTGHDQQDPGANFAHLNPILDGVDTGQREMSKRFNIRTAALSSTAFTIQYLSPALGASCTLTVSASPTMSPTAGSVTHTLVPAQSLRTNQDAVTGLTTGTLYYTKIDCGSDWTYTQITTP